MKFFSKLFGEKKQEKPEAPLKTSDDEIIDVFMKRSELWNLRFTPEVIRIGIQNCKIEAAKDDAHYKLPEYYGTMVIYNAQQGDEKSQVFLTRALQNGATEDDFTKWWNAEDLMRRMLEWELEMRKHKLFRELTGAKGGMTHEEAIIRVRKALPEFGDPEVFFGEGRLDKYLPVELQFKVDLLLRELSSEQRLEILRKESSFNAHVYKELMPQTHATETNKLDKLYQTALKLYEQGSMQEAFVLAQKYAEEGKAEWGADNVDFISKKADLSHIFIMNGDYLKAEEALKARFNLLSPEHERYAVELSSIGQIYTDLGRNKEAVIAQHTAYRVQNENDSASRYMPIITNNYAYALAKSGEYEKAIPRYKEAIQMAEKHFGKEHERYANYLANITVSYLLSGQPEKALQPCAESTEIRRKTLGEAHPYYAENLNILSNIHQQMGEYEEAITLSKKSLKIKEDALGKQHIDYALALGNLAMAYFMAGDLHNTLPYIREAAKVRQKQMKVLFPSLPEKRKQQFYQSIQLDFDFYLAFSCSYAKEFPENLSEALNMRLATKGILLESSRDLKKKILRSGKRKLIELQEEFEMERAALAELYESGKSATFADSIFALEEKVERLEQQLHKSSQKYGWFQPNESDWKKIQAKLKPNEVAIEVIRTFKMSKTQVYGETQYVFLIIKPEQKQPEQIIIENGRKLESELLKRYSLSIRTKYNEQRAFLSEEEAAEDDFNDLEDIGIGELYNSFWGEIGEKINKYEKVYFSPDGVYNQISLQTLFNSDSGKFLLDECELHILGNLKDLLNTKQQAIFDTKGKAYMIGAPDYSAGITKKNKKNKQISYLPGAKKEVQSIEQILNNNGWETITHYDAEATEEAIYKDLENSPPQVIHFSTHGFFQPNTEKPKKKQIIQLAQEILAENPLLRSGLLLAGAEKNFSDSKKEGRDGILTAFEVLNLWLDGTELVTLSACETGLGENENGEGVYGLQRAFHLAGADSVLMSMWKVPDEQTQELMVKFYKYWLELNDKQKAFRKAQQDIKSKYPEPYFWGAFVMMGI